MKLLCKLGIHRHKELIGIAPYPYDVSKKIIAFGCRDCGKKLKDAFVIPASLPEEKVAEFIKKVNPNFTN